MNIKLLNPIKSLMRLPLIHLALWSARLARPETQTTEAERQALAHYATGKKRLAEIGVWHGVTTCRLRSAMDANGLLVAIDPFQNGRLGFSAQQLIAHSEVDSIKNGMVRWMRMTGTAAAQHYATERSGDCFDFVFIDGDHSFEGLREDWQGWSPLLEAGGIVTLHDSHSTPERQIDDAGSVRYTQQVILSDPHFEVIGVVDSLTVLRRK